MGKESENNKAVFDALSATGQGEEIMAVVPAEVQPGVVTIAQEAIVSGEATMLQEATICEEGIVSRKTAMAEEVIAAEKAEKVAMSEQQKSSLIVWKSFPKR